MAALAEISDSDREVTAVPETPVFSSSEDDDDELDDFMDQVRSIQVTPPAPRRVDDLQSRNRNEQINAANAWSFSDSSSSEYEDSVEVDERFPLATPTGVNPPVRSPRAPERRRQSAPERQQRHNFQPGPRIGDIIDIIRNRTPDELLQVLNVTKNTNVSTYDGHTLLHHACINDKLDMCRVLIDAGANVNAQDHFGRTPLMEQIASGNVNIDIIKLLLANGARVNDVDHDGHSALYFAINAENNAVIRYLIDNNANVNELEILDAAAKNGSVQILELLLSNGADINKTNRFGQFALQIAFEENNYEACTFLRENGAGGKFKKHILLNRITVDGLISLETDSNHVKYKSGESNGETKVDINFKTYNPLSLEYESIKSPPWVLNGVLEDPMPFRDMYKWLKSPSSNDRNGREIFFVEILSDARIEEWLRIKNKRTNDAAEADVKRRRTRLRY